MHQDCSITRPVGQQLKCQYLEETIQTHNIVQRVEAVYQGGITPLNLKQLAELEDIDKVVTVHKLDAEK